MAELEITLLKESSLEQEITLDNEPMSNDAYEDGYKMGYDEGYTNGSTPVYHLSNLGNAWRGAEFSENTELTIRIKRLLFTDISTIFYDTKNLKSVKLISDSPDTVLNISSAFRNSQHLELIDLTEFNRKFNNINWFLLSSKKVKTILGALDVSNCSSFTLPFNIENGALADIEFVPLTIKASIDFSQCPNLSDVSIQSIIDGLADLTGSTTQKVSFHNSVKAKLTDSQKATATQKNWTIA